LASNFHLHAVALPEVRRITVNPTCFPYLNQLLADLTASVQAVLDDNFKGAYLHGSFAVGDADEDSDVDFLVVVVEPPNGDEVISLNRVHAALYERDGYWPKHLEGSYAPAAALRRFTLGQPMWHYLDNGSRRLELSNHDDTNVVRWSLREYGIALAGPPASELVDEIPVENLKREIAAVVEDWGNKLLEDRDSLKDAWRQPYVVLSFCRMLHSLATGRVESKVAGARWALTALDADWHGLIERSQAERKGQFSRLGNFVDPQDHHSTVEFIRYARSLVSATR
jgi:predicted nucleotidyltransferase